MRNILLLMLLFSSVTTVGQIDIKYVIDHRSNTSDFVWIMPENYYFIAQRATHGKISGLDKGMMVGNRDYWKTITPSLRELYFTKEQLALFKEKRYILVAHMLVDNKGKVEYVRLSMSKEMLNVIPQKQLNDVFQAFWRLKPPMGSCWGDEYYCNVDVLFISPYQW